MNDTGRRPTDEKVLTGVLGPGAPELSCEECFDQLDRYVELTLSGEPVDERVPGMRAHLDGCPACAEDFESLRDLVAQERSALGASRLPMTRDSAPKPRAPDR